MAQAIEVAFGDRVVKFGSRDKVQAGAFNPSEPGWLRFYFRDGTARVYNLTELSQEVQDRLRHHGAKQKLVDKFASAETPEECIAAVDAVWDALVGGSWGVRGEGGGGILAEAVARVTGAPIEKVREQLRAMSDADKAKLRKTPKVLAAIHAIELERAANGDGGDDILDQFGA